MLKELAEGAKTPVIRLEVLNLLLKRQSACVKELATGAKTAVIRGLYILT